VANAGANTLICVMLDPKRGGGFSGYVLLSSMLAGLGGQRMEALWLQMTAIRCRMPNDITFDPDL
jgi:hypothetical protein